METNNNPPLPNNELNNANDKYFKGMMSLVGVVRAFAEQFLPRDVQDKLDLDTLEFDNTSYITDELSEFFADMVWKCQYKNGHQFAKISFLLEHKSYKPTHPHFQLLDYIRGAWRLQAGENKRPTVIVPIVLYHGKEPWEYEPLDSYFGVVEPELMRFLPSFDYILVNLQKYSDKVIKAFEHPHR
jgi:predicted transposase/invertase (TIGR01784 family)